MQFTGGIERSEMPNFGFEVFNHWTIVNTLPLPKGYSLETSMSCATYVLLCEPKRMLTCVLNP
jgi:hypothetical protein